MYKYTKIYIKYTNTSTIPININFHIPKPLQKFPFYAQRHIIIKKNKEKIVYKHKQ